MGLKLHHVKALPQVDAMGLKLHHVNELFDKNWVSAILLQIISIYSF